MAEALQELYPGILIPLMILNGITGKALPVYGQGAQIRDWLHVEDHCEAIWQILTDGRIGETYCVGGDNQPTNLEIVYLICDILDQKTPRADGASHRDQVQFVTDRLGHDFRYDINIGKIEQELGWKPSRALREGLEETIDWYLANPGWIDAVTNQSAFSAWINANYDQRKQ